MKKALSYLLMYILLLVAVLLLAPPLKRVVYKYRVPPSRVINLEHYKEVTISFPCDHKFIGIVTRCDSVREITFKIIK